jgi:hypothetical protein
LEHQPPYRGGACSEKLRTDAATRFRAPPRKWSVDGMTSMVVLVHDDVNDVDRSGGEY